MGARARSKAGLGARERHVVLFVKAPRFGAVKTRLAADIGPLAALRFYRENTRRLIRALGRDPRWRLWLAVTPDGFAQGSAFWPPEIPRLPQGAGDLGRRMDRVMRTLPLGPALIIGSDIPAIRPSHLARAFEALGGPGAVLGPTPDGGYWLVGLDRRYRVPRIFDSVNWSSGQELEQTRANIRKAGLSLAEMDRLADVDTGADYRALGL